MDNQFAEMWEELDPPSLLIVGPDDGLRATMVRIQAYQRELERKNHVIKEAPKDLKESESMLVHAEKLSMLGELIELVGEVPEGIERVGHIVRDLRSFAMKGTVQ